VDRWHAFDRETQNSQGTQSPAEAVTKAARFDPLNGDEGCAFLVE